MNMRHHDVLRNLAERVEATSYLEIGVQEGDSLAAVVEARRGIDVTLCDPWGDTHGGTGRGSHAHIETRLDALGHTGRRTYLDGLSTAMLPLIAGEQFDIVHVDGDHSYEGAAADVEAVWAMFRHALVVHDIDDMRVRRAVFDVIAAHRAGGIGAGVVKGITNAWLSLSDHMTLVLEREP